MPLPHDISVDISRTQPVLHPTPVPERTWTDFVFFIPRCFGVKNRFFGVLILIVIGIFLIAGIAIAFDSARDSLQHTPVPKSIPFRKSLPNIS